GRTASRGDGVESQVRAAGRGAVLRAESDPDQGGATQADAGTGGADAAAAARADDGSGQDAATRAARRNGYRAMSGVPSQSTVGKGEVSAIASAAVRIGVYGALGRMGQMVVRMLLAPPE